MSAEKRYPIIEKLTVFIYDRPWATIVVALVLTALALAVTVKRFKLATNLAALLPEDTTSSIDHEYVKTRVGSPSYMEMIMSIKGKGAERKKNLELAKSYLPILESEAKKLTDIVDFTFTSFPLKFVKRVFLMSQSVDKLTTLYNCLRDMKERSLLGLEEDEFSEGDEKDCLKDKAKTPGGFENEREPSEFFTSDTGYLIWFIKPTKPSSHIEWNRKSQKRLIAALNAKIKSDPRLSKVFNTPVTIGGGYKNRVEEYARIRSDLKNTALVTLGLLLFVILIYFRKKRSLTLIFVPLILSIIWTLGATFVFYDNLNLITAFIFAILLGMGIDFGIHLLSRYFEERDRGATPLRSMVTVLQTTGVATTTTAATTALTFFALLFTSFKGFSQFGFIAGVGVISALVAMFTVLPAVTFIVERYWPMRRELTDKQELEPKKLFTPRRFPAGVAIALLFIVGFVVAILLIPQLQFEHDFRNLRSINPKMGKIDEMKSGATRGLTVSPSIALTPTPGTAPKIARILRDRQRVRRKYTRIDHLLKRGHRWSWMKKGQTLDEVYKRVGKPLKTVKKHATLKAVATYQDLFPKNQLAKLKIVKKIYKLVHKKTDFIPKKYRGKVGHLQDAASITKPITAASVPPLFKRLFREQVRKKNGEPLLKNGKPVYQYGNFALIFPDGSMYNARNAMRYSNEVGGMVIGGERVRIAAGALIFADVIRAMKKDGQKALILSFVAVFLMILINFAYEFPRRLKLMVLNHLLWFGGLLLLNSWLKFGLNGDLMLLYSVIPGLMCDLLIFPQAVMRSMFVLAPLTGSVVLLAGIMVLFNIKISFYNMIVFPMIIGVGIDNGIHIFHRYMEEGPGSMIFVLRTTGSAVGMATLTTIIGFSGMLVANHLGLQAIGKLSLIGLGLCFFVAVTYLPALLAIVEKYDLHGMFKYPKQ